MRSWSKPTLPTLPTRGDIPTVFDTSAQAITPSPGAGLAATLYVCGITPYDATHLGHAATYVAFDTLNRVWRDAGLTVTYVQNITDIDDPLLERANATGVDWQELAESQIELFRTDMSALRVLPPDDYIGAVEAIPLIVTAVEKLLADGFAYTVESGDVYYRIDSPINPPFGSVSHYDAQTMAKFFAERGGDPDTPGKENPLDALLWRSARPDEPAWDGGTLGAGRPGWHVECAVISHTYAGTPLAVQAGGNDLIFPHHEMCAAHATALTGKPFAHAYLHTGMTGYQGEKMSKSLGNLVLVSKLREAGVDPRAIRLLLHDHHYRVDWMYEQPMLDRAEQRLATWLHAASLLTAPEAPSADALNAPAVELTGEVVAALRAALHADLDTPAALSVVDDWASRVAAGTVQPGDDWVPVAVDALLGIELSAA